MSFCENPPKEERSAKLSGSATVPAPARGSGRFRLSPVNQRRWKAFRKHKRGYVSLWIFLTLLVVSLFAEIIANDKPLLIQFDGQYYMPILTPYPETFFGGDFATEANYRDPYVQDLIEEKGWMIWPVVRFSYDTIHHESGLPAPSPPSDENWLGTDEQGRDIFARILYGFRICVLFGILLTVFSSVVGIVAGAVQGYFAGWIDLSFQRLIEVWQSLPSLYLLIIISAVLEPGFWTLLGTLLLFSWMTLTGFVRAEFLRGRNLEYVAAAQALGLPDRTIMYKHIFPNAMVTTLTYLPFILSGSIITLTSLDFLGYGMPPGSPSLGELLQQGKSNLHAPWVGLSGVFVLTFTLGLLVSVGEALRDAFDVRVEEQ